MAGLVLGVTELAGTLALYKVCCNDIAYQQHEQVSLVHHRYYGVLF